MAPDDGDGESGDIDASDGDGDGGDLALNSSCARLKWLLVSMLCLYQSRFSLIRYLFI
jgi:hypothetical protein